MVKSMADEKILSYNDVVLRKSDLDILRGPYFLNDRIVEFYFSYLSSCYPSQDILLVPPSICFWVMNCPDPESLKDVVEPLKLREKKLVLFSVNNNDDVTQADGGTHWSLLVFYRKANVFVHHDSGGGGNGWYAKRLYRAAVGLMGMSCSPSSVSHLECTNSPQQTNGYDCGLYVTAIAKVICHWHENSGPNDKDDLWLSALKEQVTPSVVAQLRNEILRIIRDLMSRK